MSYILGRRVETGVGNVTLDGAGAGTLTVTYADAFTAPPHVTIVPHEGDGATVAADNVTTSGFRISVTGSALTSRVARFVWAAFEKS